MSGSLNKVMLIGRLGRDPEVRTIPSGVKVANFSIATDESYKGKDGQKVNQTEWHRIVMWRGLAEIAEKYLRKGSQAYFEGKIKTREWDDQSGGKHYTTEIIVDSMQMLGGNKSNETQSSGNQDYSGSNVPLPEDYDLPF